MTIPESLFAIRSEYQRNRSIFIEGSDMRNLLVSLGASPDDFDAFCEAGESLEADPTLPFRRSRNGRFILDWREQRVFRGEPQPFILTDAEDFVRHDSGKVRRFADLGVLQENTVLHALLQFKAFVIEGVDVVRRAGLDYESKRDISTVFLLRTVTSPSAMGEPALEGVHTDGVDHTMTTMLATSNTDNSSGITLMHDMREESGLRWHETAEDLQLGSVHHRDFLDTLIVVDNERKHSVTPVRAVNESEDATRDMAIFFTRKPVAGTHPSFPYDSQRPHENRRLDFVLLPPDRA